jgi:hypothetical protein
LPLNLFVTYLITDQKSGDRRIIGWRPYATQPKYWIDMHHRFFLTVSRYNCCARVFSCDLIARVLAHVEVRSGNTNGEGRICAA